MRRLIPLTAVLVLAITLSTPSRVIVVHSEDKDCDTEGSICRTISNNLYNLCMATRGDTGKTESDCTWEAASYTIDCMRGAGCPVND